MVFVFFVSRFFSKDPSMVVFVYMFCDLCMFVGMMFAVFFVI